MAASRKTREMMKCVSHQQAGQLLHNKFIVVLGDSIQRSVYKDLVLLLQKDKRLSLQQLRKKGEMSFELDHLVEGGCLNQMHNGTEYREVRQFQSAHHLVRFYFVTRIYSRYMQSILDDFSNGLKPDVVIVNSCVWDISRYSSTWKDDYKENLSRFFDKLRGILPEEALVLWSLTMPLAERIKGGFLVPEIEHKAPNLRYDVVEANFYSGSLADARGIDVLDLHFQFRFALQHRTNDGVHWNALAHRRMTSLLLQHAAQAWGVKMPCPLTAVEDTEVTVKQPVHGNASYPTEMCPTQFLKDSVPCNLEDKNPQVQTAGACRPVRRPRPCHKRKNKRVGNGYDYRAHHYHQHYEPPHYHQHYEPPHYHQHYEPPHYHQHYEPYHQQYQYEPYLQHHHHHVMRSRQPRQLFAPYYHRAYPYGNYY